MNGKTVGVVVVVVVAVVVVRVTVPFAKASVAEGGKVQYHRRLHSLDDYLHCFRRRQIALCSVRDDERCCEGKQREGQCE
jgi:hypothetical protein